MITITNIDHFVLTVASISATCEFYERVLGMEVESFGEGRTALKFGGQKINLHKLGKEFEPKALRPIAGSGDFCLITQMPVDKVITHLGHCNVDIEHGPVAKVGAKGPITSVYFRDPDNNLVEVASYD